MGEQGQKSWRRNDRFRRWPEGEAKSEFPAMPYPENSRLSVKQIAYLHAYCGKEPRDIVARYPKAIALAQVHLALFHFFSNREAIDAEIATDLKFNRRKSLDCASMSLPSLRDASAADAGKVGKS